VTPPEQCKCLCHEVDAAGNPKASHIFPCCDICRWCRQPIRTAFIAIHEARCFRDDE
jgi:hypothetical protein